MSDYQKRTKDKEPQESTSQFSKTSTEDERTLSPNVNTLDQREQTTFYGEPSTRSEKTFPLDLSLGEKSSSMSDTSVFGVNTCSVLSDSFTTLYDEFQNTILEVGFEEKVRFSEDFKPTDIKLKVEDKRYIVHGRMRQATQEKSTTVSFHSFEYIREFNRKIKNVEIEVGKGVANVYGEFDD